MQTAAIIVAAGRGTRMGGDVPKQWQSLAGRPVLATTVDAFRGAVDKIVVAIHPDDHDRAAALGDDLTVVHGGATRAISVRNALEALSDLSPAKVLIHDGARPLVPTPVIARVLAALDTVQGAAPAIAVTDALWRGASGQVVGTQDRAGLWRAQTPQGFRFDAILTAHRNHPGDAADDVEVARAAGIDVAIVEGDEDNLKLTFAGDFARAERILAARKL